MTNEHRKVLTEFLGECYHEGMEIEPCSVGSIRLPCNKCGKQAHNRTFTSAQDMVDLARKMVEKGVWERFHHYAMAYCGLDVPTKIHSFTAWLITNPERFCQLVYDSEVWEC